MEDFLNLFNQYARSELMVLIPVLYFISKLLGSTKLSKSSVSLLTCAISVVLCGAHTLSNVPLNSVGSVLLALFTSFTQGVLYTGVTLFGGILLNPQKTVEGIQCELDKKANRR